MNALFTITVNTYYSRTPISSPITINKLKNTKNDKHSIEAKGHFQTTTKSEQFDKTQMCRGKLTMIQAQIWTGSLHGGSLVSPGA